ncbi:MAG: DUF2220 family protein [Betaproteobacteria bacterium]|nr:DUF2220 family protein [Betaproteobacteria bacterium]
MSDWTTVSTLRAKVLRDWMRGHLLAGLLGEDDRYPWRIPLQGPASRELAERFDDVRAWARALIDGAKAGEGLGYRLEMREFSPRSLGRNELPVAAWLDGPADALALIGKRREAARFEALAEEILAAFPGLRPWLVRKPLRVLDQAEDWPRLLAVLGWILDHPGCGLFVRQIDLPGVHSKFVERHRGLLSELLDALHAPTFDPADGGGARFERRYGFRSKPVLIRFRLLGSSVQGLTDLSVPADEFGRIDLPVQRVFMTENEINYLAFPAVAGSVVIFGAGYGFEALAQAAWLHHCEFFYWGDIDTHGFAILNSLRGYFPHARSLLMDRATLLAHRPLWGREASPTRRALDRLRPEEASLFDDLRNDVMAPAVRLEQERIAFGRVLEALAPLSVSAG